MDLPVIMMSEDGGTSTVMKGIRHGACYYLIKPIRIEELQNIWQHVVRKKHNESKDFDYSVNIEDNDRHTRSSDDVDYASSANEGTDPSASKKPRVVWSVELHQQFVNAVNQLGIDKAVPKKILELMRVPRLTRENVASHLQKYRLYLKRLSQQQNGMTSSFGGATDRSMGPGGFGRFDLSALAASGQLSPQALAALPADLLGRINAANALGMSTADESLMLQASLQDANSNLIRRPGQTLVNDQGNSLQRFPGYLEPKQFAPAQQQQMPHFVNGCSSVSDPIETGFSTLQSQLNPSSAVGGMDSTRQLNGNAGSDSQKNALLMQLIHQRQESNQHNHQMLANAMQPSNLGQSKSPPLHNGELHFSPVGSGGTQAFPKEVRRRTSFGSPENGRGYLGNNMSIISGSEEVNHLSTIAYGRSTTEVSVSGGGSSLPAIDCKSQSVASLSRNEYAISNTTSASSPVSTEMGARMDMPEIKRLIGINNIMSSPNMSGSRTGITMANDIGQMSRENGRPSWEGLNMAATQDSTLSAIGHEKASHGTKGVNVVPIQDAAQMGNFAFCAEGSSFAQNTFPSINKHSQNLNEVSEANMRLKVKAEREADFSMNMRNEYLIPSEPFTEDLMNMLMTQHSNGSGLAEDGFNLERL
eukprot:TRINITY_DN6598_c2_g1_i2.p1 TRINITY_DN6598_c2_g1~~TRINITY_DN6598_c2_g1_i2.p1  ORF type:complete len:743 (+),score=155.41 TRINITY_DN6598_c2_g1_i2:296-2230(+)